MPEDDTRNGLRVGGWIPPYSPGADIAGPIRPTAHPATLGRSRQRDRFARVRENANWRPHIVLVAALCLACAAIAAVVVTVDATQGPEPVAAEFTFPAGEIPVLPGFPTDESAADVPVSVQPSPSATSLTVTPIRRYSSPPTDPAANPAAGPAANPTTDPATTRPTTKPAKTTTPPVPPVSLTVGSTAGLEAVDRPGQRVRHRNYRARLDPIGSNSSDGERADSGFRVRTGLADSGCVSLESVNFPGYYLRHRNFEIRLDRFDGTTLFRQDATFCPVTIRRGAALALRSVNYPYWYVVADGEWLKLAESTAEKATAFKPRPAL